MIGFERCSASQYCHYHVATSHCDEYNCRHSKIPDARFNYENLTIRYFNYLIYRIVYLFGSFTKSKRKFCHCISTLRNKKGIKLCRQLIVYTSIKLYNYNYRFLARVEVINHICYNCLCN